MAQARRPRLFGWPVSGSLFGARRDEGSAVGQRSQSGGSTPERLVLAPQDLHTSDPTVAQEIYAGMFYLAGKSAVAAGRNPFTIANPPSPEWERELHAFGWLRHLGSTGEAISATNAQALVKDWIAAHPRPRSHLPAWDLEIAASRLIAWLCNSVMLVEHADITAYRRLMRAIGHHVRYLRSRAGSAREGMPRLVTHAALAYADVCLAGARFGIRGAQNALDSELSSQILADGGHVSRNPAVLPEILALLLPLRQSFARLGKAPSTELISAIDRMMSAVRFFRMGDGSLARFNGASGTAFDLVTTVLRYDDTNGQVPTNAPFSGYQRLVGGETVIVMDTGRPLTGKLSETAHAGTLSFEMSSGAAQIIVNCGAPPPGNAEATLAARSTAAHSTAILNDTSSCKFQIGKSFGRKLDPVILAGPSTVRCQRQESEGIELLHASHDGYERAFGFIHERQIGLSADGAVLIGSERLRDTGAPDSMGDRPRDAVAVRFHLHPSVEAFQEEDGSIGLRCASGEDWQFTCADIAPELEDSIFFANSDGARRTTQIALYFSALEKPELRWKMRRQ